MMKDHVTLNIGVNAENSALPLKEYITFYNILKWKIYFIIL